MDFAEFILAHEGDDLGRLALARDRHAGEVDDFDLALTTLEVRRKLRTKVPEWYAVPSLRYPVRVSGEQCSSSETARYKAAVAFGACDMAGDAGCAKTGQNALCASPELLALREKRPKCVTGVAYRLADLTGGLGVDSWAFSQLFQDVLYNEMQPSLADAARHNFRELGVNILVRNFALAPQGLSVLPSEASVSPEAGVSQILGSFQPDILFLDPARRAADGRKVFRLEDCQPDVLQLLPELLAACPLLLLKLSPMADITLVCKQLGCVKEVHVVAAEGECKELLLLLERDYSGPFGTTIYESGSTLSLDQVPDASGIEVGTDQNVLFEPGKAMLKAGAFDLPCRYGLQKLGQHTHLYTGAEIPDILKPFGKCYQILEVVPLNNRTIKEIGKKYLQAEVTARNIPITSEQLRAKLGVKSGGNIHLFGVKTDANQNQILVVRREA